MNIVYSALLSFLLDLLLGDPAWILHPVVLMGKCITCAEKKLRSLFPASPGGEFLGGLILAAALPLMAFLAACGLLSAARLIHPSLAFLLQVFWGWQALALRDMRKESENVFRALKEITSVPGDRDSESKDRLDHARKAVGRIVGRDTTRLDVEGIIKAAVESVAESFSDGVIAPMCYLLLGGAPLALCYKAVNTMDSMIGYRNERYLYFGRAAARLDDAANYIPSRLSAVLLILASALCSENTANAARIWKRDRRKHASPNSAQTESAMAGALGLQLGGPAWYFGEFYEKPFIGDPVRSPLPEDILRANRLMYAGSFIALALLCLLRVLFCRFF